LECKTGTFSGYLFATGRELNRHENTNFRRVLWVFIVN